MNSITINIKLLLLDRDVNFFVSLFSYAISNFPRTEMSSEQNFVSIIILFPWHYNEYMSFYTKYFTYSYNLHEYCRFSYFKILHKCIICILNVSFICNVYIRNLQFKACLYFSFEWIFGKLKISLNFTLFVK